MTDTVSKERRSEIMSHEGICNIAVGIYQNKRGQIQKACGESKIINGHFKNAVGTHP